MNKLLLSAAITAALFGGQAQAAITLHASPANNPITTGTGSIFAGTVKEVWISGSSAATPFVEKSVIADCSGTVYKYANSTTDLTWICNSSLVAGTVNVVHKRDGGGSVTGVKSAQGIYPTYSVTASLDVATCATAVSGVSTCTATAITSATHAGDIDLADVDGAQFEALANGGVAGASTLTANALATQIFGVVVNTRLYTAMQVASVKTGKIAASCLGTKVAGTDSIFFPVDNTDACMPSLTSAQISAIFGAGRATDWYNLYSGGTDNILDSLVGFQAAADQPLNTNVHYCSRTAGSGTLAAFNIKFENQCSKSTTEAIVTTAGQTISAETDPLSGNQKVVHSMSGSGDLENCLEGLDSGAAKGTFSPYPAMTNGSGFRWAIGIMGLDRNASIAKNYRFIKVDGIAPTAANTVAGKYKFWAELVNLSSPTAPVTTNPLALDILANLGSASQITALNVTHPFGLSGFLGTATNALYLPTYDLAIAPGTLINAAFDAARPVNPWTHAAATGAGLNHCRTPSIPTGARAIPAFN